MRNAQKLLCLALALTAGTSYAVRPQYQFTLDAHRFDARILPVVGPRKGVPSAGDLAFIRGIPFVLPEPGRTGHFAFRSAPGQKASPGFYCTGPTGPSERLVVAQVTGSDNANLVDPLSPMPTSDKAGLWGVILDADPANRANALADIDWSRTGLTIGDLAEPFRDLPTGVRYLTLKRTKPLGPIDFSPLTSLTSLRYLSLELHGESFSFKSLPQSPELVNLSIKGATVSDLDHLAKHSQLLFLKLRSLQGLDNLSFTRHLPRLRVLKVDDTAVSDLLPLTGLRELRLFSANKTKAAALPPLQTLPTLRDLRLHSTPLAENENQKLLRPLRSKMNVLTKNWDPSIRAFEAHDQTNPPPENPILFIGSSSIRGWDLKKSFPTLPTLNRGFGGSELSDSLRYFNRIVLPYRPRAIILYAGDNDIAQGETAQQVTKDFKSFSTKIREYLPDTQLAFLAIKPSLKRWNKWTEMNTANEAIRRYTTTDPRHLHYLDIAAPMLGPDGKPLENLFAKDGLHLNNAGYAVWNQVVQIWLDSLPTR